MNNTDPLRTPIPVPAPVQTRAVSPASQVLGGIVAGTDTSAMEGAQSHTVPRIQTQVQVLASTSSQSQSHSHSQASGIYAKKSRSVKERIDDFLNPEHSEVPIKPVASLEEMQNQLGKINFENEKGIEQILKWIREGYLELVEVLVRNYLNSNPPTSGSSNSDRRRQLIGIQAGLLAQLGSFYPAAETFGLLGDAPVVGISVFRALAAYNDGDFEAATDKIYQILDALQSKVGPYATLNDDERYKWIKQVQWLLIACLYQTGSVDAALALCENYVEKPENAADVECWFNLGKLRLQVGHVEGARDVCDYIKNFAGDENVHLIFLKGLCNFAESKFDVAFSTFERLVKILREEDNVNREVELTNDLVMLFKDKAPLMAQVCNNLAVCALHCCKLDTAISVIEYSIKNNPYQSIHQLIVFNLCTLYDLARPIQESQHAKHVILGVAEKYGLSNRLSAADLRLKSI
uniref:Uncharacterized protein n=1 Tax=Aplanochytrium stocchinoi TaxID=215587 RepID=A0A7S3LQN4_9STRA|mmetsp:Transcript_16569/g.21183  ORF Transcript_16569/g.21183 Transcript_16569/m.21183 type:complete len:463 (-) Transcript_16569:1355-2743(-)